MNDVLPIVEIDPIGAAATGIIGCDTTGATAIAVLDFFDLAAFAAAFAAAFCCFARALAAAAAAFAAAFCCFAVIAGAAAHLTLHTSSGSLVAGDAALAGAADHSTPGTHATSGALTADAAVIAGTATHLVLHTSTGSLVADSASIAGTALHTPIHAASGGLVASEGALLGIALRTPAPTAHDATGGLVAGAAEIAGLATGPALPFFSVSGGGIKPKHHKKPTPSLFDEELKAPTAKLKKAVVPSFTPSTFVPYAKMGVPKALSKALGEVLVGPLSAPLREVLPPEYDDDDIPDEVIMLALQ